VLEPRKEMVQSLWIIQQNLTVPFARWTSLCLSMINGTLTLLSTGARQCK